MLDFFFVIGSIFGRFLLNWKRLRRGKRRTADARNVFLLVSESSLWESPVRCARSLIIFWAESVGPPRVCRMDSFKRRLRIHAPLVSLASHSLSLSLSLPPSLRIAKHTRKSLLVFEWTINVHRLFHSF